MSHFERQSILGLQYMGIADSVLSLDTDKTDHLLNGAAVDRLGRSLPSNDPINAQTLTCASIYTLLESDPPSAPTA